MVEFNPEGYKIYEALPQKEKFRFKPVSGGFMLRSAIVDIEEAHEGALVERRNRLIEHGTAKARRLLNNPPAEEELFSIEHKNDQALKAFIQGGSLEDFHKPLSSEEIFVPGVITLEDAEVLEAVLRSMRLPEESVKELVEHESKHYSAAKKCGLVPKIILKIFRSIDGELCIQPATQMNLPRSGDENKLRTALRAIVEAPHESLSDSDQERIGWYDD